MPRGSETKDVFTALFGDTPRPILKLNLLTRYLPEERRERSRVMTRDEMREMANKLVKVCRDDGFSWAEITTILIAAFSVVINNSCDPTTRLVATRLLRDP